MKVAALRAERGQKIDAMKALVANDADLTAEQATQYDGLRAEVKALDTRIERAVEVQGLSAESATPVNDNGGPSKVPAQVKGQDFVLGRMAKSLYAAQGNIMMAAQFAEKTYGGSDVVVRALNTGVFSEGGATVPEDFVSQVIDLLRPRTVVRALTPNIIPMPRGTMRMAKQTGGVNGSYGPEGGSQRAEKPKLGSIVATFKKLTVKVPISNDWLRYTSPGTDALVQKDIIKGLAGTEDLAFLRGDGSADWPKGLRNIAIPGSNIFVSVGEYTLETVDSELTGMINALETQDVGMEAPAWVMNPRAKNFLMSLKNSNGFYVYKDEMAKGTLKGYPFKATNRIPNNLGDGTESEIYFADFDEAIIFDAMSLAMAISQEATYQDENGAMRSAFDHDETIIRAIAEHDFHLRHDQAVAILTGVKWGA